PVLTFMGLLCSFQTCFICCKMGATITCCQTACDRTFHLPCAPDGQCVTQYFGAYRSFCWEHRPQQALRPRPSQDNTCTICLDTVEDNISYITMACPACQDARFHRHCIQRLALHAGIDFRCPRCLKQEPFMTEMLTMGIRLSKRPPSWQSDPDVGPSDQRHGRCDATRCLCPGGREHSQAHGPWQLRLCSSCAAEGIHRLCSSLGNSTCSWECSTCAATDTGRQQSFQHYAIHTGTTMGLAPGPSAQLGSWKGRDTTAASPACSLRTVLTTFLLPAPLCRFHWQIRPCGPQNLKHRTADSVPGHGAPQEQLLHQPSAGLKAALRPRPSQDNTCTICLDTVEDNISYITMACPACQDARFHRHCIQRLALHAGIDFRCPRCLKQEPFMTEMLTMGIRLSKRPPSWQSDPDVGPSDQRHGRCDATRCLCPGGREHSQAHGQDNTCTICLDTVEDNISYITMACPACQDARFHRHCIQRLALHAGIDFRCPRCLKQEPFMTEMLTMGIRLSKRPPSWQSDPDVGPSDQRHGRCDATRCLCPGGREHSQAHG
ncbi:LOW QUALITY PROTEIN: uncharacterized protein LOC128937519, partial [Melozone crissalis]|uniref:LOW QUALITY PROTEIN: uncharacterized protein LOC128937519 n=1 Tax=Melozone crissalis TaxID=40204 RepID=UPI0023DBD80D